jgi:carbon-monoxide dehydrogenase medium subunit
MKEALQVIKRRKGRTKLIAGGTNVIPDMRARAIKPDILIDISNLRNFSYIKEEKRRIRIGGLTTISELASSRAIRNYAPILSNAASQIGNPLVRNRATIGGNLADASPAADTAVPLLVLDAMVMTEREGGNSRQIQIDRFFLGPNQTALRPDEVIREVFFPKPSPNSRTAYIKLGLRNAMAISVVSVAILREMEKNRCKKARIGFGAVAPKPIRAYGIEEMLMSKAITGEVIEACCERVQNEISPITDIRATAEYRRSMASVLLRRVME